MKKLVFPFIASVLLITSQGQAQSDYKTAIGGRAGVPIAGSIKHFISEAGALEGYLGFLSKYGSNVNVTIGGMYQHHFPIGDIAGFKWYVGGGALVQFYSYDNYDNNNHDYSETGFALNAVGGVDYKFRDIPLNLSADIMPAIFISNTPDGVVGYGGISVRYTFK
jgi:hypothetical protein